MDIPSFLSKFQYKICKYCDRRLFFRFVINICVGAGKFAAPDLQQEEKQSLLLEVVPNSNSEVMFSGQACLSKTNIIDDV
jgi:hypothetical protein